MGNLKPTKVAARWYYIMPTSVTGQVRGGDASPWLVAQADLSSPLPPPPQPCWSPPWVQPLSGPNARALPICFCGGNSNCLDALKGLYTTQRRCGHTQFTRFTDHIHSHPRLTCTAPSRHRRQQMEEAHRSKVDHAGCTRDGHRTTTQVQV